MFPDQERRECCGNRHRQAIQPIQYITQAAAAGRAGDATIYCGQFVPSIWLRREIGKVPLAYPGSVEFHATVP